MLDGKTIKVIIPALNEAESIGKVLAAVPKWIDEVLVVDNGSTDATAAVAAAGGARVVREGRRGYGRACLAGLAAAQWCDVAVFLDADFSDYPEQMGRLVRPIVADEADLVIGSRVLGGAEAGSLTGVQRFGNTLACGLMGLLWRSRHSDLGPFRAVRWSSLARLGMRDETYGWTIEMQIKAARLGLRVREAPVSYRRRIGVSKISGTVRGAAGAGCKILATIARYALSPPPARSASPDRLIVFSRYPLPGRAKTRLMAALGPLGAADLQRRMTRCTLDTALSAGEETGAAVEIRYAGGDRRKIRRWLGGGFDLAGQGAGDLGRRMKRALDDALAGGCRRAVLVGTDCPALTTEDLRQAFAALDRADLVLGPSTDGGYWLIGLRRPADVFRGVHWSTPAVLPQTLDLARAAGLSVRMLRTLTDVDTPQDLPLLPWPRDDRPYLSVIIPALNEAPHIGAAVASARGEGIEVIVVDGGGSTDATARLAAQAGARVLACPRGRACQMNRGAAEAGGRVLLFLHADTVLPDGYVEAVFDALCDGRTVGGAFTHQTDLPGPGMTVLKWLVGFRARHLRLPYGDQAIFVRREDFQAVGGFPDVALAEDLFFVRALRRRGRIAIAPAVAVTSGRRWRELGALKTTLINQAVVAGCWLGVEPNRLARLYGTERACPVDREGGRR